MFGAFFLDVGRRLAASLAAYASLAIVAWSLRPEGEELKTWQWIVISLSVLILVYDVSTTLYHYIRTRPRTFATTPKGRQRITRFMYDWIRNSGRTAIYSRDMSWATEDPVHCLLIEKARNDELVLVLPRPTPLSAELEAAGAQIVTYMGINHDPRARFTIADYGRGDARVAIGITQDSRHRIEVYAAGTDHAFQLSEDLLRILSSLPPEAR